MVYYAATDGGSRLLALGSSVTWLDGELLCGGLYLACWAIPDELGGF